MTKETTPVKADDEEDGLIESIIEIIKAPFSWLGGAFSGDTEKPVLDEEREA